MNGTRWGLMIGVFLGNWLAVPTVFANFSYGQGFLIGIFAAVFVYGFSMLVSKK